MIVKELQKKILTLVYMKTIGIVTKLEKRVEVHVEVDVVQVTADVI